MVKYQFLQYDCGKEVNIYLKEYVDYTLKGQSYRKAKKRSSKRIVQIYFKSPNTNKLLSRCCAYSIC